jgi:glucose-6-phosphate 1-dehydrogenase
MNIFIFGGTGDLAKRKLLPALYRHFKAERLSPQIKIYGIGSSSLDILSYQQEVKNKLSINLESIEYEESMVQKFIEVISYIKIDFNIDNDFESLKKITSNKDRNLFYLAVTPVFYKVIADNLDKQSVIGPRSSIIVEKPIGNDLQSSIDINESLALYFNENQIFRIDHYLGKEAVQNLLALRFGNILFEKIWSNVAVDHVQITVAETLGLEKRGSYYDQTGAIKDMLQNHLLQILMFGCYGAAYKH